MKTPIFVTGIGTGIGKTLISAIIVEKLQADYWKPIQSGDLEYSDTDKVKELVSNPISKFHTESHRLTQPLSPHKSAALDGIEIEMEKITLPQTSNQLIIEGAGGLMVPLNDKQLMVDLISHLKAEVVLVSQHYLGSINHTLLSIELLKSRNIPIIGIIFNGDNTSSEDYILNYSKLPKIGSVGQIHQPNKTSVKEAGIQFF